MLEIEGLGDEWVKATEELMGEDGLLDDKDEVYEADGGVDDKSLGLDVLEEDDTELDPAAKRRREAEDIYGSIEEEAEVWQVFASSEYTITKLTAGVRDPNRVNVFLDSHFAFSLDITQVVDFGLKVGQKVSNERYEELKHASEFGKLYQRTLEWAMTRPHSIYEVKLYLKRRQIKRRMLNKQREHEELRPLAEFPDEMIAAVLERLVEKRYIDDQKFAEYYVENRYVRRGISQKRLRMELYKKGVAPDIANAALKKIERPEDEEIMKVIAKKRKKYNDFQLAGYLTRQGFNFQQSKEAVAKWNEEHAGEQG